MRLSHTKATPKANILFHFLQFKFYNPKFFLLKLYSFPQQQNHQMLVGNFIIWFYKFGTFSCTIFLVFNATFYSITAQPLKSYCASLLKIVLKSIWPSPRVDNVRTVYSNLISSKSSCFLLVKGHPLRETLWFFHDKINVLNVIQLL
jgi:hypothetical protein